MGAPKAGDRDHACQMAQSGFESVEIKGMHLQLDVFFCSQAATDLEDSGSP